MVAQWDIITCLTPQLLGWYRKLSSFNVTNVGIMWVHISKQ